MRYCFALILCAGLHGQTAPPASAVLAAKESEQLETRMLQLIESTAVSVPGLVRAAEPVRQNAEMTLSALQRTPQEPALTYQFINQVKAYLALADAIPRPYPFPPTADRQFAELRESLQRIQQHFEGILQVHNVVVQARQADPSDRKQFAEANAKLPPPTKPRVVFMGDAITDAWRLNEYFTGRDFVNRGIDGQTTGQMLGRFLQDAVSLRPRAVVILAGSDDIARGVPVQEIEDNLAMMGDVAKAHGIKPIFASILPVSDYHKDVDAKFEMTKSRPNANIVQINNWLKDYCKRETIPFVDYYTLVVDKQGQFIAEFSDDGLRPNARGFRVMSPVTLEAIGRVVSAQ